MTTSSSDRPKVDLPVTKEHWRPSPLPGHVVLVTTLDDEGRPHVAPKSWISMAAAGPPPILMFGCTLDHATARHAQARGQFVVNVPGADLIEACWAVGTTPGVPGPDRFTRNGLTPVPASRVAPPRIAECRAHLECETDGLHAWGREVAIFGRIVAVSVDAAAVVDDTAAAYDALRPFFFLENGWAAPLGPARKAR